MKLKEKNSIIKEYSALSDDDLVSAYEDLVLCSLGSQVEDMYDLGYDMRDIKERAAYEKYLVEKCDVLEGLLSERNLVPWN